MKKRILAVVALVSVWVPARAIDNLASLLPEDTTVYFSMQDAYLFESLGDHPIQKAVANSELKKIFAPLIAKQKSARENAEKVYKEELGMTIEEMQKLFKGGMAMGMKMDIAKLMLGVGVQPGGGAPEVPKGLFEMTLAMNFAGDDTQAEKIARSYGRIMKDVGPKGADQSDSKFAKFPEDYDVSSDDYAGVKLHIWRAKKGMKAVIDSPGYAVADGTLIVSMSEDALHGSLDRLKKGAKSLADSPRHSALAKTTKDNDVVAYFDLGSVVKSAMNTAAQQGGVAAGQTLTMLRAFGVNKLDLIYMTADLSKNRADLDMGLTFHDNPGIMKVIAMDGPGIVPNFFPPDADSASHGTMHFDRMLTAIEGLMKEAVPAMGDMIGQQLDEMKKQTGVDIRKDIIANIGPDIVSATAPAVAGKKDDDENEVEPTVLALHLKDRKTVELAVNTLINKAAPDAAMFEKREYQGVTINNFKEAPIGYLFTDDWFVLSMGPQTLLEKVITRMAKGGDDHLFAQPVVKSAFAGLPDGDDGSSFFDLGQKLDALLEMAAPLGETAGLSEFIDFKNLPKQLNLPLVMGSRQYLDDNSFHVRIHIAEKTK